MSADVYYPSREAYTEHGWWCPEMGVLFPWREGEPESRRPLEKYRPQRVTRTVGAWLPASPVPEPGEGDATTTSGEQEAGPRP